MRRALQFFSALIIVMLLVAGAGGVWAYRVYQGPGPAADTHQIVVTRGAGVRGIAGQLADAGAISSRYIFMAATHLSGQAKKLKAGEYEFAAHMPMRAVIDTMVRGDVVVHRVTIPEGLTSWQAVQILNRDTVLSGPPADVPPDGSLLPETYTFLRGDTRQSVIDRMRAAMDKTLDTLWRGRDPGGPFQDKQQAVTLASIVEKETGVPAERARVAGVFLNRLRQGIPLQSDPTVIYAITNGQIQEGGMGPLGRRLLSADLQVASPYNTYKNPGLPPGPIANPGADALAAVLHPEANTYLYFVANGTGGHVFASTLDEHNRNVQQWRQIRKQQ